MSLQIFMGGLGSSSNGSTSITNEFSKSSRAMQLFMNCCSSFGFAVSPFLIILSFLLVASYCAFFGSSNRRNKKNLSLPPGPAPLPIIGNLHELLGQPIHIALRRLAKEHGPLMHLQLGQATAIAVSSMEVASEILRTQDTVFCSRPGFSAVKFFSYGGLDIGASPYGNTWRKIRRLGSSKMFCTRKVQSFSYIREQEVDVMVSCIKKKASADPNHEKPNLIDMSKISLGLFNNITHREVYSRRASADGDCMESPHYGLIRHMMKMMTEFNVGDFFPSFWWVDFFTGWRFMLYRRFREMDRVFEKEIKHREMLRRQSNSIDNNTNFEGDFLDELLLREVEMDPSLGYLFSRKELKALLMDMFLGGTDTSSVTLEWGMTELMRNPEIMKKAQEEVRRVAGDKGKVEESDVGQLHYLKMVIKETLRLHPPTTLLAPHLCMKDTKVHGYDVLAGTIVIINAWAIGRNPRHWTDPEAFRPERFEGRDVSFQGNHFEFIPFSSGRRMCPGMALGLASIELAFSNLLYSFDWSLPEGMKGGDIDMTVRFGLSSNKKKSLLLLARTPTPAAT